MLNSSLEKQRAIAKNSGKSKLLTLVEEILPYKKEPALIVSLCKLVKKPTLNRRLQNDLKTQNAIAKNCGTLVKECILQNVTKIDYRTLQVTKEKHL